MHPLPHLLAAIPIHAGDTPSVFAPAGPAAAREALMGWVSGIIGVVVLALVCLAMVVGLWRRGHSGVEGPPDHRREVRSVLVLGLVLPALILAALYVWSTYETVALAAPPGQAEIEVVGRQWWWEVRYPGAGVVTANELHIPVGVPVLVRLSAADVAHSFWVPRLMGKMDLIPGDTNMIRLQADSVGSYMGTCAEYCGVQHAHMGLVVVASEPAEYRAWLAHEGAPAAAPVDSAALAGAARFETAGCAGCHTVRGTAAAGEIGPDLTHIATRLTVGAGMLPNNRGNLGGWVADPQHVKPGNLMPTLPMTGPELHELLEYLGTLQ